MVVNADTRPRKSKRKLPLKSIVDPELVSAPTPMLDDILLMPSQHDRVILSQLWDTNETRSSELAPVILGVLNQKKQPHSSATGNNIPQKTYLQRLKENTAPVMFDLSTQSIIPTFMANTMSTAKGDNQYTNTSSFVSPSLPPPPVVSEEDDSLVEHSELVTPEVTEPTTVTSTATATATTSTTAVAEKDSRCDNHEAVQDTNSVKETNEDSEDSSSVDVWLDSCLAQDEDRQNKVYQDIFDMMSTLSSSSTPLPSSSSAPELELAPPEPSSGMSRKNKLAVLKASKELDWMENVSNSFATTQKQKKVQRMRRQKLLNKLHQPYIIKKKIKCIWYIE
ncbi:hypothetical protein INT47_004522 [Mucor saturninus]|uniref:Uncharacterized protein n=1 Tax=Mucor saturninus TaxID=64648 RepID=A0A8H7V6D5_9FUNG|nr:hypothetical protein INT47_004522 [Mucor saturninus]